jgi:putative peptidoglycan lipid II flippase
MVKKFFEMVGKEIVGLHEAAYLLAFFAFLSQILALVRDKLLAYNFGAGHILDIYYSAFRIPDLIFVSVASIVSASVLVPFFIDRFNNDGDRGRRFIDSIFSAFFFGIVAVSIATYFLIPSLTSILFPGFANSEFLPDLILYSRILLLSPIFLGLSNFLSSITQMHKRFLIYALSPVLYNIGIIFGIVFLYPVIGISGLIWGVVIGAFLHMAIQIPFIIHKDTFPSLRLNFNWNDIKKVILISLPRTLTLSSNQLASFFLVSLASYMSGGTISVFRETKKKDES